LSKIYVSRFDCQSIGKLIASSTRYGIPYFENSRETDRPFNEDFKNPAACQHVTPLRATPIADPQKHSLKNDRKQNPRGKMVWQSGRGGVTAMIDGYRLEGSGKVSKTIKGNKEGNSS